MMEEQLRQSKEEADEIFKMKEKVEEVLEGLAKINIVEGDEKSNGDMFKVTEMQEGRDIWEQLETEFS